jgi:hypothetical protein
MQRITLNSGITAIVIFLFSLTGCGGGSVSGYGAKSSQPNPVTTTSQFANRTSGIAPLSVFFDATGTTSTTTSKPFHELLYVWDFGDSSGSPVKGTKWDRGSQSAIATCASPYNGCRNNAIGPVAAHVFENTGTFTVTLKIYYDATHFDTKTQAITVSAYSGKTYCIHHSAPLGSGVCSGVEHATTGDIKTDVANAIAAGAKQILFKRGDTYTTASGATISTAGPGIVGSYGSGAIPVINTTSTLAYNTIIKFDNSANDWRLMDLDLEGIGGNKQYAVGLYRDFLTVLRVTTGNVYSSYDTYSGSEAVYTDSLTVQDSTVNPGTDAAYGWYCGTCSHVAALGNSMFLGNYATAGHDIRFQGASYFVIANSDQTGSTAKTAAINGFTIRGNSQYGEIVDNNIISFNAQILPQNTTSNENQRDIVVERNFFTAAQLQIQANNITVRNNVFNLTGYTNVNYNAPQAVAVGWQSSAGSPMATNLYIYNNSTYYGDTCLAGDYCSGVAFGSGLNGCVATVKNNLTYIPSGTSQVSVRDSTSGGCTITGTSGTFGNSTDTQVKSNSPNWSNGSSSFSTPSDFKPTSTSYAIGSNNGCTGAPCSVSDVPVITDFFGNLRTSTYDMGAVNH